MRIERFSECTVLKIMSGIEEGWCLFLSRVNKFLPGAKEGEGQTERFIHSKCGMFGELWDSKIKGPHLQPDAVAGMERQVAHG